MAAQLHMATMYIYRHLVGVARPQLCILLQALHQGVQGVLCQLAQLPSLQHEEQSP